VHQVARLVDEGPAAVALFVEQPLAEVSRAPGYGGEPVAHAPHVIAGHSRDPKAQFPCLGHLSSAFLRLWTTIRRQPTDASRVSSASSHPAGVANDSTPVFENRPIA